MAYKSKWTVEKERELAKRFPPGTFLHEMLTAPIGWNTRRCYTCGKWFSTKDNKRHRHPYKCDKK